MWFASCGLLALYLALMNGHLTSIDGLVMWRQALSLAQHHSFVFDPPIWWAGGFIRTSTRGVAASLQYAPEILGLSWLIKPYAPDPAYANYDFGLLYADRLYTAVGAPVWAFVTAAAALMVGLTVQLLGGERRAVLWAVAFFGLGSPALLGARGDYPQPLVGLCWVVGLYAALRVRRGGSAKWTWLCAAAIAYAVLTRPLEGSLLLPGVLVLLVTRWPPAMVWRLAIPFSAWMVSVALTLLINQARFGSPLNFGYGAVSWTIPIWVGFPYALLSPGRGAFWQFPAMALAVPGVVALWGQSLRVQALVLGLLPAVLFVESCTYFAWIDGWDWGFRLFQPAVPLVAVLAGLGAARLRPGVAAWLPAALLGAGIAWNVPAVVTDLLGGYAAKYDNLASWSDITAYPPIGAWQFLHHIRAQNPSDSAAIDLVWFRQARSTHWLSVVPFAALLGAAAWCWLTAFRRSRASWQ